MYIRFVILFACLIPFGPSRAVRQEEVKGGPCNGVTQGILTFIKDHKNLESGCMVTAVLKKDTLKLLRGNEELLNIKLETITPPILIVPNSNECFVVPSESKNLLLCSANEYSRDSWWMQITKQILCNNQGALRNEIYGEASVEEQHMDLEHMFENRDNRSGINIHIDGTEEKLPQIKVHYKK
ncbi:conserved hypothetical protein [Theileria equi strain WA]|uniref:Signal peptide containing protein n=1 Tax=Theileria equi strain WA TaxID=1537102 RepID=L1LG42_THEEQ|nr:conserved hypothetical protein [Theileria equi strain WA]EKX74407.1 conserved hypothetical protein [Theileria equi strain WA]|eukprot:XP_004833859.1 conserved hypothetical protein [Theileria equi strain WA]